MSKDENLEMVDENMDVHVATDINEESSYVHLVDESQSTQKHDGQKVSFNQKLELQAKEIENQIKEKQKSRPQSIAKVDSV